jgi:Amt family ammonium transporter
LVVLGTFVLWFGWYGLNCGATLATPGTVASVEQSFLAAQVAMNTTISAATAGLVALVLRFLFLGRYDLSGFCKGILAGLVAISAACGNVECWSACTIGAVGAIVWQSASLLMRVLKVDDPVDAFAVHGATGMWGVLAAALFDWGKGFDTFHGANGFRCTMREDGAGCADSLGGEAVVTSIASVVALAAWSGFSAAVIFALLRLCKLLMPAREECSSPDGEAGRAGGFAAEEARRCRAEAAMAAAAEAKECGTGDFDETTAEVTPPLVPPCHLHTI